MKYITKLKQRFNKIQQAITFMEPASFVRQKGAPKISEKCK